jgi:hypothetical protein
MKNDCVMNCKSDGGGGGVWRTGDSTFFFLFSFFPKQGTNRNQ